MAKGYFDTQQESLCCGCGACVDVCRKNAIHMEQGYDKAMYPRIDSDKCVSCGLCRKVCPITSPFQGSEKFQSKAYALVQNEEASRMQSASGGAFDLIAVALAEAYPDLLIAGAAWESATEVRHKLLPADERMAFKKSKYLQSDCTGIYREIKSALEQEKTVLFTGTPCQVAALKNYVGGKHEKLFAVDLVCHGVPGAEIFRNYAAEQERKQNSPVVSAGFREKRKDIYGEVHSDYIKLTLANGKILMRNKKTDAYLRGFHRGLFYRESCYSCPYAAPDRVSDITIGDYWHIQSLFPEKIDYTGVSAVLINTPVGEKVFSGCSNAWIAETEPDFLIKHNGCLRAPTQMPSGRKAFFENIDRTAFSILIDEYAGKAKNLENRIAGMIPGKMKRWLKNRGYRKWMKK